MDQRLAVIHSMLEHLMILAPGFQVFVDVPPRVALHHLNCCCTRTYISMRSLKISCGFIVEMLSKTCVTESRKRLVITGDTCELNSLNIVMVFDELLRVT